MRRLEPDFVVPVLHVAGRRQDDVRQQLVGREHVLHPDVLHRRHREVVGSVDDALAVRTDEPELRAVRDRGHSETGRMDDVSRTVAEDGVELILARRREAGVPAFFVADEFFVAVIPAPRPLVDVAAQRALIANLRRSDLACGFDQRRIHLRDVAGVAVEWLRLHAGAGSASLSGWTGRKISASLRSRASSRS